VIDCGARGQLRPMTTFDDEGPAGSGRTAAGNGSRPAIALVAGVMLLAIAAAFAALMRRDRGSPPVSGMDHAWLSLVSGTRSPPVTDAFRVLSLVGGPWGATVIVAILCAGLLIVGRWRTAIYLALAEALGSTCSDTIKRIVLRHRPPHPLVTADLGSFPSGHVITTLGVGIALTLALVPPGRRRRALTVVAAAALLMMYCRTYLAAHWLSDTFESLPVAGGLALVLWWVFEPWLARDRTRPLHWPALHWPALHWPALHWPTLHWPTRRDRAGAGTPSTGVPAPAESGLPGAPPARE
jgi:membrane-associated phospholipid phosphatase